MTAPLHLYNQEEGKCDAAENIRRIFHRAPDGRNRKCMPAAAGATDRTGSDSFHEDIHVFRHLLLHLFHGAGEDAQDLRIVEAEDF